jgi:hypothetical protein
LDDVNDDPSKCDEETPCWAVPRDTAAEPLGYRSVQADRTVDRAALVRKVRAAGRPLRMIVCLLLFFFCLPIAVALAVLATGWTPARDGIRMMGCAVLAFSAAIFCLIAALRPPEA